MPDAVCRLSVQAAGTHTERAVDLVLPADTALELLLPMVVTLAHDEVDATGHDWRLDDAAGTPIDRSQSLVQNGIHDGALLFLRRAPAPIFGGLRSRPVTDAADADAAAAPNRLLTHVLCAWAVALACAVLAWSGARADKPTTAAIACGTALVALGLALRQGHHRTIAFGGTALALGGVTGFLAVPAGPAAANVLLGCSVVLSVAVVLLRTGELLLPVAAVAFSVPLALSAALATCLTLSLSAIGAAVAALALAGLTLAPRIAITIAGLAPESADPLDSDTAHTDLAQSVLTGTVFGSAAAAAVGACTVAVGSPHARLASLAFIWALAAALLLRVPSYHDPGRRWAVLLSGICCTTTAFAVSAAGAPQSAPWLGLTLILATLAALRTGPPGAVRARWLVRAEYVALVAVIPTALWVCGVYSLAQGQ
ncbi:type VII secretion integral membrane protein EccD [Mycobacterium sp. OTB74]|jgi:type VII secretion integral membrane protein EccD|uniref:type VII secretion integral membrane protein EccD n=1 Tax=Mycobacterium sp. OTB74 TaxID=1853452 RepID=UPI002474EDDA|nr:type VII secretion integral membrane protein EccD [Mycobacterium sp. OTB74]MDH6244723.1 type VII secretion integral membrane protein EccD [Mycobacterium sp. OTB74]